MQDATSGASRPRLPFSAIATGGLDLTGRQEQAYQRHPQSLARR